MQAAHRKFKTLQLENHSKIDEINRKVDKKYFLEDEAQKCNISLNRFTSTPKFKQITQIIIT